MRGESTPSTVDDATTSQGTVALGDYDLIAHARTKNALAFIVIGSARLSTPSPREQPALTGHDDGMPVGETASRT